MSLVVIARYTLPYHRYPTYKSWVCERVCVCVYLCMYCTCLLLFSLHFWCCFLRDTRNILPCANFDLHINQVQWMSRIFQFRETNLISGDSKRLFRLQATFQNTPHCFWSQIVAASSSWCDLKTDCSLFQPLIMNLYNVLIDSTPFDCDILTLYQMTTSFSTSQLLSLCIPYVIRNISQFTTHGASLNSHWHPPHPNWNRIISVSCL